MQIDTNTPIGTYLKAWTGYSQDPSIRRNAASGGVVSAVLIHLIETQQIQGALLCRSVLKDGHLGHEIFIAKTRDEVLAAQSSKYYDIPLLEGLKLVENFDGLVAVVGLPSQINSISRRMAQSESLGKKIVFKVSLFCGHNSKEDLLKLVWKKRGIRESEVEKFYFRQGLWRGQMVVEMKSGQKISFPFQEFSHYQNLHILSLDRCLNCFDHMGYYADLAVGDIWTREAKKKSIKPSAFLARSQKAVQVIEGMKESGELAAELTDRESLYLSQRRAINFHYQIKARARLASVFGFNIQDRLAMKVQWRDYLAAAIVLFNHRISRSPWALKLFFLLPKPVIIIYLYLFKGLTHYKRKVY